MNACPSQEQLEQFLNARLSDFDRSAVNAHVQTCCDCQKTVSTLGQNDRGTQVWDLHPTGGALGEEAAALPPELVNHPRYNVLELLEVGGMGAVYKAEHRLLERTVALKIIRQDALSKPEQVQRFLREAKLAAGLSHANIVTLYEAEKVGQTYFLVMEYLAGTDLFRLIKKSGPLPVEQACEWARQAAAGLQYIHERGLVHRDIKPSNLFLVGQHRVKRHPYKTHSLSGHEVQSRLGYRLDRFASSLGRPMGKPRSVGCVVSGCALVGSALDGILNSLPAFVPRTN